MTIPSNYQELPADLPIPVDDGATRHLIGMRLPDVALQATNGKTIPEGWDLIPGARGCTPQSCSFRDHYQELGDLGAEVIGLSVQTTQYQKEMADRLHLPFPVVSDVQYAFQKALNLPTFEAAGMTLLKRVTLIANQGVIEAVHYPIFPSDSDAPWVIQYLKTHA